MVNGATHANDAVAMQAQSDLTTAYNVAAGQPVAPANDLTGTDLGNRTLTAGAYRYTRPPSSPARSRSTPRVTPTRSSCSRSRSTLTTASASSVVLINGASPCNVYWQVGSSATLGTTTAFQGNLMALTSISLNNGAYVIGRLLARNGQISLINNVLDASRCGTATPLTSGPTAGGGPITGGGPGTTRAPGSGRDTRPTRNGTAIIRRTTPGGGGPNTCTDGFSATVRGHLIQRVLFSIDGKRISRVTSSPFRVYVKAAAGRHMVRARVTFKDSTRVKTLRLRYRACAAAVRQLRRGPSRFTG